MLHELCVLYYTIKYQITFNGLWKCCVSWTAYMLHDIILPFNYQPRTMSLERASMVPYSFLSFSFISPLSLRWHFTSRRRLWLADFSILMWLSSSISSPSLYHCTFIGSRPTNSSLKVAFWPTLIITGSENLAKSSWFILGGSEMQYTIDIQVVYQIMHLHILHDQSKINNKY